jgi:protein-S-isoprenylcysteine O-methyltransferase Ste14
MTTNSGQCIAVAGYIRHPMYGGLLLAGLGLAGSTHDEVRLAMVGLLWWVLEQKVSRKAGGREYAGDRRA